MIDDLRSLAIFAAVAEAGSFSAAARRLRLSTSVVSHHVTKLEARLGAPVLFRSTRALSLTPEGAAILPSARAMIDAAGDAFASMQQGMTLRGTLRVTLPEFGEHNPLRGMIWRFARAHPQVSLSVLTSDSQVNLVKEGFDVAIRLGQLADSAMKSTRLGSFSRRLVASPTYLAERAPICSVQDLMGADFLRVRMLTRPMTLHRGDEQVVIDPPIGRLEVHSIGAAKSAVLAGLGLHQLPASEVDPDIAAGRLVEVLPEWSLANLGIFAVWPQSGPQKQLTRRFIDFLKTEQSEEGEV